MKTPVASDAADAFPYISETYVRHVRDVRVGSEYGQDFRRIALRTQGLLPLNDRLRDGIAVQWQLLYGNFAAETDI